MSVTWQNVKDFFYETVGDSETAEMFFAEADVTAWAKESMREAAERTNYADKKTETVTVANDPDITLGSTTPLQIWRAELSDEKLLPITSNELRRVDPDWATRTGLPRFYLLDEFQTDADAKIVRLYEIPTASDLDVLVYAYGVQSEINDSSPTQPLNLPEWFAYSLVFGMLAKAYESDTEMQNYDMADFYRVLWDDAVMRLRIRSFGRLQRKWVFRPSQPEVGLSIRNRIPETIPEP